MFDCRYYDYCIYITISHIPWILWYRNIFCITYHQLLFPIPPITTLDTAPMRVTHSPLFCVCECCLPYPALPLTVDNVFEAVKTVRLNYRELARWLMGWSDFDYLDAIKLQHISDEERLKAVVEVFLLGEGLYQPSWRILIHRLHLAWESHLAEKIKTNAEPQQGEWVSVWMWEHGYVSAFVCTMWHQYTIIRGEPERAPNTWETGSGFICT